jgi:hypothetical protein
LSFTPTKFNAEFINDFLPFEIIPDVLLMNPPFSSSGERTVNNSSKFGFRHVELALGRLKKGGKFGIIPGNSAGLNAKTVREFWRKMSRIISIKAIIKIPGAEYAKNGTRVDVNLITGRKNTVESKPSLVSPRQNNKNFRRYCRVGFHCRKAIRHASQLTNSSKNNGYKFQHSAKSAGAAFCPKSGGHFKGE